MASIALTNVTVTKITSEDARETSDLIATEAPLQIVLKHFDGDAYTETPVSLTMRSEGNDEALVVGFLYSENIIRHISDITQIRYCETVAEDAKESRIIITLIKSIKVEEALFARNFMVNSSCGVCGKQMVEQLMTDFEPIENGEKAKLSILMHLPIVLREKQLLFKHTGGIHACGLFDFDGNLILLFEDIGRHNALDKVIGGLLIQKRSFKNTIIVLSGRVGYEMMQKTAKAKIPLLLAIGAPTSLAVEIADSTGVCLLGFAKKDRLNIYTHSTKVII